MIKHIVWWTLKDEAEGASAAENALKIKELGDTLIHKIDALKSLEISVKIQNTTTVPAAVILQSSHDSMEKLSEYANHPEHLVLVDLIKKVSSSRNAIDYEI